MAIAYAALGVVAALMVANLQSMLPPLAAALLYIAQRGDAMPGSLVLFALGYGYIASEGTRVARCYKSCRSERS